MKPSALSLALLLPALACGGGHAEADGTAGDRAVHSGGAKSVSATTRVLVYKTASCGCCNEWVEHLREAGFTVDTRDVVDLMSIKRDAGVSAAHASCHTALADGYVVEGHVPADQIERLLAERPRVAGLAVPGMPVGSPGMEGPGAEPYQVLAFERGGGATVWATVDPR